MKRNWSAGDSFERRGEKQGVKDKAKREEARRYRGDAVKRCQPGKRNTGLAAGRALDAVRDECPCLIPLFPTNSHLQASSDSSPVRIRVIYWKGLTLLLLAFCWLVPRVEGQVPGVRQLFEAGNSFYAQGNFRAAAEEYEKIVQMPFASEVVYYNLGNAYFKDGQLGKAILYYEKAFKLSPRDRDIADNLSFATSRIADKVEKPAEGFLLKQLKRWLTLLPLDVETCLALGCFVTANACFAVFLLGGSPSLSRGALVASLVLLGLFLLFGSINLFRIYQAETVREAVILTDKVDVLSGPSTDNPTLFSIHEGLKVQLENEVQDWVQISLENGWNGWVKKEVLGII